MAGPKEGLKMGDEKSKGRRDVEGTSKGRSLRQYRENGDNPVELSTGYPQAIVRFLVVQKSKGRGDVNPLGRPFDFGVFLSTFVKR